MRIQFFHVLADNLMLSVFLILLIWADMKWYIIAVLTCFSLLTGRVYIFSFEWTSVEDVLIYTMIRVSDSVLSMFFRPLK